MESVFTLNIECALDVYNALSEVRPVELCNDKLERLDLIG
jgi:hypothetical protein